MAITDGLASDHFLRFGKRAADRQGAVLRQSLFEYFRHRLSLGAHPHFVFQIFSGTVKKTVVKLAIKSQVPVGELEEMFKQLGPNELIEVVADGSSDTSLLQ